MNVSSFTQPILLAFKSLQFQGNNKTLITKTVTISLEQDFPFFQTQDDQSQLRLETTLYDLRHFL